MMAVFLFAHTAGEERELSGVSKWALIPLIRAQPQELITSQWPHHHIGGWISTYESGGDTNIQSIGGLYTNINY